MKNVTILIVLFIVFTQCKKKEIVQVQPLEVDYRDSFCGKFSFTTISGWETISNTSSVDTTTFKSIISKIGNTDSLIIIKYKTGNNTAGCGEYSWGTNIKALVRPNGKLVYDIGSPECPNTRFEGHYLQKDSLEIAITTRVQIGGQYFDRILGTRR